ncbi:MAG: type II toxin-antitoxin system HicB family antitoxin [Candidatus Hydrothermarchaeales archaeon]
MLKHFTLEYWIDDDWYVGRLKEIPGIFSQGGSLQELEENIQDAYHLMIEDESLPNVKIRTKEVGIEV